MPKVNIDVDEMWPCYFFYPWHEMLHAEAESVFEVDDSTFWRWTIAQNKFNEMQTEIAELWKRRAEENRT